MTRRPPEDIAPEPMPARRSSRRQRQLLDAERTLRAIQDGDVDSVLVNGPGGPTVVSLQDMRERDLQRDLREAQALAKLGTWTYRDGVLAWSDQMYELHDRDPALGPPPLAEYCTLFAGAGAATVADAFHAALGAGQGFDADLQLVGGKWCHLRAQPVRDPLGLVAGLRGTAQDMTAARVAEAERKAVEARLRFKALLLASVGQAVIATDASGHITYWGPGAVALYGWEPAEVLGRLVTEVTPSHASKAQGEEIMANLAAGQSWSGEFAVERRDGSSFIALVNDNPILDDDGHLVGVIGVSQDISAMKAAVDRVRFQAHLLESVSQAVVATDREGRVTYWNPAAQKLFGWSNAEAVGRAVVDLWGDALLLSLPVDAHEAPPRDHQVRHKDGSPVLVNLGTTRLLSPAGALLGFIAVGQDATPQRLADEARRAMAERDREVKHLSELARMRMEFLNSAAHDLKTPLTPLTLEMATLRLRGDLDPQQMKSLDLMARNVTRFQVLVDDMLDAARLQSGQLRLRRAAVDMGHLVQEAVASFQATAHSDGLHVVADVEPGITADADSNKLMQVLMNLVSNAVKYTPRGGGVQIRLAGRDQQAHLTVTDTGLGMTADQVSRLFQPFVRLHADQPGVAKGTGLGLYICKGIADQHGGRLWAESTGPGHGSTFHLEWPLALAPTGPSTGQDPATPG